MKEGGLLYLGVTGWLLPKAEKAAKSRFEEIGDKNRKARHKARTCSVAPKADNPGLLFTKRKKKDGDSVILTKRRPEEGGAQYYQE